MILIADSGATKTDWCFGATLSDRQTIHTEGINPFHMDQTYMEEIIRHQLIPQLPASFQPECTAIHFYGAGCLPERTGGIVHILKHWFPHASVQVSTDLLGAARALCQREPGIACILGTGSNSCLYDGTQIIDNISPLGYILGDEGPEVKEFLKDCFREFFKRNVLLYKRTWPVSFVGSIAWYFQQEIQESAKELQLPIGRFVKNPIDELSVYHFHP